MSLAEGMSAYDARGAILLHDGIPNAQPFGDKKDPRIEPYLAFGVLGKNRESAVRVTALKDARTGRYAMSPQTIYRGTGLAFNVGRDAPPSSESDLLRIIRTIEFGLHLSQELPSLNAEDPDLQQLFVLASIIGMSVLQIYQGCIGEEPMEGCQ